MDNDAFAGAVGRASVVLQDEGAVALERKHWEARDAPMPGPWPEGPDWCVLLLSGLICLDCFFGLIVPHSCQAVGGASPPVQADLVLALRVYVFNCLNQQLVPKKHTHTGPA